jgi:PAS domain S-box-containing protein
MRINFWSRSILNRTLIILLLSVMLTGVIFITASSVLIQQRLQKQAEERLGQLLDTVDRTTSIACYLADIALAEEVARGLLKNTEVASVMIFDDQGKQLTRQPAVELENSLKSQTSMRRLVVSPFDASKTVGEIVLQPNQAEIDNQVDQSIGLIRYLLLIELSLLSLVVGGVLVLLVIRPIKRVCDGLHLMNAAAGDKLIPPPGHAHDELGRLVEDFNALAFKLVKALEEEHDIRLQREVGEKKYRALFDNAEAGIFMLNKKGLVISCNPAFLQLTGLSANINRPSILELLWCDKAKVQAAIEACFEKGVAIAEDVELSISLVDNRWLHMILTPIETGLIQGVMSNITELVWAKQAAETANRAKSVFLTSMSHELRTPLNSIIGFAQLLEMDEVEPLTSGQQESVDYILNGGRHLLALINQVLDLARIESGLMDLRVDIVDVTDTIQNVIALTRPLAAEKNIEIQWQATEIPLILVDKDRLRQILLNLLTNAIKYNYQNGRVELYCQKQGQSLVISVKDNGQGIAENQLHKIFQPFQRLGMEKMTIEGTGIGLNICKQLIEGMQGRIGFETEENVGSRFWIELPIHYDL